MRTRQVELTFSGRRKCSRTTRTTLARAARPVQCGNSTEHSQAAAERGEKPGGVPLPSSSLRHTTRLVNVALRASDDTSPLCELVMASDTRPREPARRRKARGGTAASLRVGLESGALPDLVPRLCLLLPLRLCACCMLQRAADLRSPCSTSALPLSLSTLPSHEHTPCGTTCEKAVLRVCSDLDQVDLSDWVAHRQPRSPPSPLLPLASPLDPHTHRHTRRSSVHGADTRPESPARAPA